MINSFLLIGQSNMAGRGKISDENQYMNPNVFLFKNNTWVVAKEPFHHDLPTAGAGLAASFGDLISKKYSKKMGLIPCAFGGSTISQWQPGEVIYENAVKSVIDAQKSSVLKGILWHQGENDSCLTLEHTKIYEKAFNSFFSSLLNAISAKDIPFIIGELGRFLDMSADCIYWREINTALCSIANKNNQIELVSSFGLNDDGDSLHFDTPSLREFGKRYAKAWEIVAVRLGISLV